MPNSATQEPLLLERAYIEGWVLALTFGAEEELRAGRILLGLVLVIMTLVVQAIVIKWATIKARLAPTFPRFFITFNSLASDARWWVVTLMIFLVVILITSSPFIEQQGLPQSSILEIVAALVFVTIVFCAILSIGRRYQHRKLMLSLGAILIVASLAGLAAGAALVVSAAPSVHSVIHEPPSPEDIANATVPIRTELDNAKQQVASLQSQLAIAIRERDTAQQSNLTTPSDTVPSFALTYTLTNGEIKNLAEQFFEIKDQMPSGTIIQAFGNDNISYGMGQQLAMVFGRANLNPGIEQVTPLSPKEVGITIRVGDAQSIPDGARKTAQIFKNVLGIDVPIMRVKSLNGDTFRIFTGPRP